MARSGTNPAPARTAGRAAGARDRAGADAFFFAVTCPPGYCIWPGNLRVFHNGKYMGGARRVRQKLYSVKMSVNTE
jgi:hypothetical protein